MGEQSPAHSIGILGGGQLGRMLSVAASRLGMVTHVFAPDADPIAGHVAHRVTAAEYSDVEALTNFAEGVDVITYEFENIPAEALDVLERRHTVFPRRNALAVSQDRLLEKNFLNDLGLQTAPYANVESEQDLMNALATIGVPSILKTRRWGYDGHGQARLSDAERAIDAWAGLDHSSSILEGVVSFVREISVIVARSRAGDVVSFEPGENVHAEGILRTTTVPARISESQRKEAFTIAERITNALDYIGVMGVELFVSDAGLFVNEIAPRVHNSGHWTQNGCVIDQFEQHIRAITGWPLGDGRRHSDVVMANLIGDDVQKVTALREEPGVAIHLYGKNPVKPGRKMGHVNRPTGPASN